MPTQVSDAEFQPMEEQQEAPQQPESYDIKFLEDVYLPVSIELGRTKMAVLNIVQLEKGSVIEFDKLAGETVDLLVNDRKFAEGEVVVIDEHFGIRITGLYKTRDLLLGTK
ncbi:MAG: flagellar motor switch protein FliN [bacterium]|nr:flagellar motor switch protein FliN [bacterium]